MRVLGWMPRGQPLSAESWQARHRVVQIAAWLSVPGLGVAGLAGPASAGEAVALTVVVAAFAGAGLLVPSREVRADVTSFGLILASFAAVELSGGQSDAHLFILSAVALVSLSQRWAPLLFTIGAVLVHHVLLGFIATTHVFSAPDVGMPGMAGAGSHQAEYSESQIAVMVLVHTCAVAIEVVAILLFWRFSEQQSHQLNDSLTQLRSREEQLQHQATHDSLTGLANRACFADEVMNRLIAAASFAVLMLDLDDFKQVNDTYGHHCGDELLEATARRISSCVRDGDLVARLGGDEFAVLLATATGLGDIQRVADRILAAMAEGFALEDATVNINVSIGIARADDTVTLKDLMVKADSAMYLAKRQGKGQWVFPTQLQGSES